MIIVICFIYTYLYNYDSTQTYTKLKIYNICLLMEKKSISLKPTTKNVNFPAQFCLESISNGFGATESRKVSLKGNVYDFSVDCNAINKSDILNTHKYLMVKNYIE